MKLKPLRHIMTCLRAALLLGLAASCSDDIRVPADDPAGHDIETGISIRIPNLSRAADFARSRAEDPVPNANTVANEGGIHKDSNGDGDMWLYIFSKDDAGFRKSIRLSDADKGNISNLPSLDDDGDKIYAGADGNYYVDEADGATYYKVPLVPGEYKVYILANLSDYIDLPSGKAIDELSENEIEALKLHFNGPLEAGNLPMVCLPGDVDEADEGGYFNVLDDDVKNLHCNLRFLCSKVRYTILFDKTSDGFSYEQFQKPGSTLDFDINGVSVGKVVKQYTNIQTPASTPQYTYTKTSGSTDLTLRRVDFDFTKVSKSGNSWSVNYPSTDKEKYSPLTEHDGEWQNSDTRRAWQGVAYLPENLSTASDNRTQLFINGIVDEEFAASFTIPLNEPLSATDTDKTKLKRGFQYDIVALAQHRGGYDINLSVNKWDIEQLVYTLEGPFYLHVDQTVLPVVAGQENKMWFETNVNRNPAADELEFVSPEKDGKKVYFGDFVGDSIFVRVNPDFAPGTLDKDDKTITFFHIRAKNLLKRIEVSPLRHEPFFTLSPEKVEWNVRDLISSKEYSGNVDVTASTNMEITDISYKWDDESEKKFGTSPNQVSLPSKKTTVNGVINDILGFSGINDPEKMAFWKVNHTLKITYTAVSGGKTITKTIDVNIKALRDTYIIHAKCNWQANNNHPHIYVYQCLEFPQTFDNPDHKDRAGKPIATDNTGDRAALEYSFTGKTAFLGWGKGKNDQDGAIGGPVQGFYYFTDNGDWETKNQSPDHYAVYDFCSDYRSTLDNICADCNNANYHKQWPGIRMEHEDGDWYKFELTGTATPGKALIMFANWHTGAGGRYPEDKEPGIPLFDYPDREGWIDLTVSNPAFSPNYRCEQQSVTVVSDKKRVWCWMDNKNWFDRGALYAYESRDGNSKAAAWPGLKWQEYGDNWYYVEINKKYDRIVFVDYPDGKEWKSPQNGGYAIGTSGDVYYKWQNETDDRPNI